MLVKQLALQPHHQLHHKLVIELLWPELNPEAVAGNLYKTVHLRPPRAGWESWIDGPAMTAAMRVMPHTMAAARASIDEQAANQAVSNIDARRTDQQSHHYEERAFFQHEAENAMIGAECQPHGQLVTLPRS